MRPITSIDIHNWPRALEGRAWLCTCMLGLSPSHAYMPVHMGFLGGVGAWRLWVSDSAHGLYVWPCTWDCHGHVSRHACGAFYGHTFVPCACVIGPCGHVGLAKGTLWHDLGQLLGRFLQYVTWSSHICDIVIWLTFDILYFLSNN